MKILHESPNNIFWIQVLYPEGLRDKYKEIRTWLREKEIEFQYFDSIGDYDRLMILKEKDALEFKLRWCTGSL